VSAVRSGVVAEILRRHDLVYEEPAEKWEQGIMMGNGLIGTVLWGGGSEALKLSLDHAGIWDLRNWSPDSKHTWQEYKKLLEKGRGGEVAGFVRLSGVPHAIRVPLGRLEFTPRGKILSQTMRLDLYKAKSDARIITDKGAIDFTTFISSTEQVIVISVKYSGGEKFSIRRMYHTESGSYTDEDRKKSTRNGVSGSFTYEKLAKEWGYPKPVKGKTKGIEYWKQSIPESGSYAAGWVHIKDDNTEIWIISLSCDYKNDNAEQTAFLNIQKAGTDTKKLLKKHTEWWKNFWDRSFLSIPDSRIEACYYLQTYLLGCSTRPGGLHMTICGPWTDDDNYMPICDNDYHWNNEQEMQIWPVYVSNRLDFGEPMFDLLEENLDVLKGAAKFHFNVDGAFLTHCTTRFCEPTYMNVDNFEFNGLPWVCYHYWMHWRFSMDKNFLAKRAYPMMKLAAVPLIHELEEGDDGYLHLPWTSSPEYHSSQETMRWYLHKDVDWGSRFGPDATIDLALLKWLLGALVEASSILDCDVPERAEWEKLRSRIVPYGLDEIGSLQVRRDLSLSTSHRHQSHLFPFYPLHEYCYEDHQELYEACLDRLGINGRGEWVGWSFPWIAQIFAYGRRPAAARNVLSDMAERYVTEGGIHYQGPIKGCDVSLYGNKTGNFGLTIEAQLGFPAAVQELLIQSTHGIIRLFDISPPLWASAVISGMRCEGAFVIDALRQDYKTLFVRAISEKGGPFCLETTFENKPGLTINGKPARYCMNNGAYCVETKPGDILVFGTERELKGLPVTEKNFYGVKCIKRF
jgi:alpha-L-fucosidase 2